jgi:hypothetical protein
MSALQQLLLAGTVIRPKAGLVAWYDFEETSGTTYADASGNSNSLTAGGTIVATTGKVGNGASGQNALKLTPNSFPGTSAPRFSLVYWLRPFAATAGVMPHLTNTITGDILQFNNSSNSMSVTLADGSGTTTTTGLISNVFNSASYLMISAVFDGSNLVLKTNASTTQSVARAGADTMKSIGRFELGGSTDRMDSVAFYNRAITDAELLYLYNAGSGKNYAGL